MKHWAWLTVAALIGVACMQVVGTYRVFNHTIDEPGHLSCGLEWLQKHQYQFDYTHPPLPRVLAAMGPWLMGVKNLERKEDVPSKNPLILYDSPSYYDTLAAARAGILPFLILTALAVFVWSRSLYGDPSAVLSALLVLTIPPVLGHSGLVTTDASVMAALPWALFAFQRFLNRPTIGAGVCLGLALAFGALSKFTFFVFFPLGALVLLASERKLVKEWVPIVAAIGTAFLATWSGYLWSLDGGWPLRELYLGLEEVATHNKDGHRAFLLGEIRMTGWWYFFPVVLFYKTPVAFLLLCCGIPMLGRRAAVPAICAVLILLALMPSRINLGIRHILPMYPLLAIPAGAVLFRAFRTQSMTWRAAGAALLAWQLLAAGRAHPDYFAYFNEFAMGRPERIRADSDLDWGQNVDRIARVLKARGIREPVRLGVFSSTDPSRHGLDEWSDASPWETTYGWVAVSATERNMSTAVPPPGPGQQPWAWLAQYEPVERIGESVLLYYIPRPR